MPYSTHRRMAPVAVPRDARKFQTLRAMGCAPTIDESGMTLLYCPQQAPERMLEANSGVVAPLSLPTQPAAAHQFVNPAEIMVTEETFDGRESIVDRAMTFARQHPVAIVGVIVAGIFAARAMRQAQ